MNITKNFEFLISNLDTRLFDEIESQTSQEDRKSLLTIQNAVRNSRKSYTYLEIGSHLGGSIQPHLLDPKCVKIYSIDKRPLKQADERWAEGYKYPNNSTQEMIRNLKKLSRKNLHKIKCFDDDSSNIEKDSIQPKPDICFIDGEHTNNSVISDFNFCRSVLNNGGVIVFHDFYVISSGLDHILNNLTKEKIKFKSYSLPSNIFCIEFGNGIFDNLREYVHNLVEEWHLRGYIKSDGRLTHGDFYSRYPSLWRWMVKRLGIRSIIDVGCGEAHSIKYFNKMGCDVLGIDGSRFAIKESQVPERVVLHDFTKGTYIPEKEYDAVWSCEFVEHVEERYKNNFLKTFQSAKKFIFMTHALPNQPGWHHVNCRPSEYWIKEIERLGFKLDLRLTKAARCLTAESYFKRAGLVFINKKYCPYYVREDALFWAHVLLSRLDYLVAKASYKIDRYIGKLGRLIRKFNPALYLSLVRLKAKK